ncbi:MAG: SH3 domain-containing protein [Lachnospiraceae bacterium]|jgi:uncharacterized protein YgiM (DUF1202 family)|nr:SH3 domain-containing protein [Lachnospiraceae bacterium]MCI9344469.1 SH3 domain-containing protein [Lachnospiraceae bacterium]GFH92923.1 hypothetical protein IMSAGC002_04196 [Lachnospiraceae bacterium]
MSDPRRRTSLNGGGIGDRIEDIKEWVSDHAKIVMPIVLLVCVLITVLVAVNANKKAAEEVEAQIAGIEGENGAESAPEAALETAEELPELELELNAYPGVNTLMNDYYAAMAAGDVETIESMNAYVDDREKIRIQEMSKYVDSYQELDVYTKLGPVEGSYLVYVYSKVKFTEYDKLVPGMKAFYVCTDENGNCYINGGETNSVVTNYIRDISLQDDMVDLNNKAVAEYNELLESDDELKAFLADLSNRIDISVGEILAKEEEEARAAEEAQAAAEETPAEEGEEAQSNTVKKVRATDVVNVRSSDSETADKLGKAQIGDEFTLLEERGNGWSKISFEGQDAFIKTEFLEVASEEAVTEDNSTAQAEAEAAATDNQTETAQNQEETAPVATDSTGETVTVVENVNVRKSASESGEKLGLAYMGEKLEVIMKQADGWTRVKYNGQTGYVKSDYVE